MTIPANFRGRAKRLDDLDLPRIGAMIGVGEDEIHAILEVESRGSGFDDQGRPLILFEPHVFWRELGPGAKRTRASGLGLAYSKWGTKPYPKDSYPVLKAAMAIDETAALRSASWGLGQVLGNNHEAAGFATVQAFVEAMCDDEENHLLAMVNFIKANRLDDEVRRHDWAGFARGYNGPGYAKNRYDTRLARAYSRWKGIRDTPFHPGMAAVETLGSNHAPDVIGRDYAPVAIKKPIPATVAPVSTPPAPIPAPRPETPSAPTGKPGFWSRFMSFLKSRLGA